MRPFLPHSKFNFPVLLKLVAIYGVIALIVFLCAVFVAFVIPRFDYYLEGYEYLGASQVIQDLKRDFMGVDSEFIQTIGRIGLIPALAPLGAAGGVLGVVHYVFVRRRRSIIHVVEESLESEVDSK